MYLQNDHIHSIDSEPEMSADTYKLPATFEADIGAVTCSTAQQGQDEGGQEIVDRLAAQ